MATYFISVVKEALGMKPISRLRCTRLHAMVSGCAVNPVTGDRIYAHVGSGEIQKGHEAAASK
jgi:hypothetical protein